MLDDQYATDERGGRGRLTCRPSEYFHRQCWVTAFTDDGLLAEALRAGHNVMVSTDWPHPPPAVVERRSLAQLTERADLTPAEQDALLSSNAHRFLQRLA